MTTQQTIEILEKEKAKFPFSYILLCSILSISIFASFKADRLIMVVAPFLMIIFALFVYEVESYLYKKQTWWSMFLFTFFGYLVYLQWLLWYQTIKYQAFCKWNASVTC